MFEIITITATSFFLLVAANMTIQTQNMRSSIIFKFITLMLGLAQGYLAVQLWELL